MHKVAAGAVVAALLAAGAACHATSVVKRVEAPKAYSWLGASVEDVFEVWGRIESAEPDGTGGRLLVYRGDAATGAPSVGAAPLSTTGGSGNDPGPGGAPGASAGESLERAAGMDGFGRVAARAYSAGPEVAKFWIDARGKVYRYWFDETVWNKHPEKTVPPAPGRAPLP